jgi:glucose-6-phosphate isomerase
MALDKINPSETKAWQQLQNHFAAMQTVSMKEMFANDTERAEKFHIQWNEFLVDYSKNKINQETMNLLLNLANEVNLKQAITKYFEGDVINQTENRAVLHTALRSPETASVLVDGKNIIPEVFEVKEAVKKLFLEKEKDIQENHLLTLLILELAVQTSVQLWLLRLCNIIKII